MTHTVTIAILDTDRYFAQGLEALLRRYFALRNTPVRFVSGRASTEATLLFQGHGVSRSIQFCRQRHTVDRQRVITVQDTSRHRQHRRPPCLSEQGMIDRHISVNTLLQDVERVLAQPPVTAPVGTCPRCAQVLTPREQQILSALGRGRRGWQIALQMHLSPKTVSTHKRVAMTKLGLIRNTDLYHWLQSGGLDDEIREFS
ncbi:helix-turn-helix transcriptional regulator [Serratia marcescens]|uniref:helix-turn-helix transcriptional regulator n=1 Tax=Serratia marcescens TaxID=615 RepID=UPI000F7DB888|nr:helix-turn-helix transcriptional regulator [Serratia marcescens]RTF43128.1 LuxR family transcriptional regulator [Serratia marcescens]RTF49516.1 LuxR family transcriptional regulator [Serratia marcescens]